MSRTALLTGSLLLCVSSAQFVFSTEVTVTSELAAVLMPDGTPFPAGATPLLDRAHGIPLLAKIDLFVEIDDLSPGVEGFGGIAFETRYDTDSSSAPPPIWSIPNPTVDSNGPLPGGLHAKWSDTIVNTWAAAEVDVRQAVAILHWPRTFGPVGVDARRTTAQNGPEYVASVYIPWDGLATSQLRLRSDQFAVYAGELLFPFHRKHDPPGLREDVERFQFGPVDYVFGSSDPLYSIVHWRDVAWPETDPAALAHSFSVDGTEVTVSYQENASSLFRTGRTSEIGLSTLMDLGGNTETVEQTIGFSSAVSDVRFEINEISARDIPDRSFSHVDQVTVFGFHEGEVVMPQLELFRGNASIEGNIATAVLVDSPSISTDGIIAVSFSTAIDQILIMYGSGPGAPVDPDGQLVRVGDLRFKSLAGPAVPEPASFLTAVFAAGLLIGISARTRRPRRS